jgi:hypothetical protein
MKRVATTTTLLIAALTVFGTSRVHATSGCIKDAKGEYKDCLASCKEDFQVAKDACINKDHLCVEACRSDREDCHDATGIDQALKACATTLHNAVQACNGDEGCIEQAQVVGFECRLAANKAAAPALKVCRTNFKACVNVCPPGAGPVDDPKACKAAAKTTYGACQAQCKDDFQTEKDACHGKSHACVDGCRVTRDNCKQPVQDQEDAAMAACQASKQTAIQNCNSIFPPGTDRDNCIFNAKVNAFLCREDAREAAAAGFQPCRSAFMSCVQGCPASPSGAFLD